MSKEIQIDTPFLNDLLTTEEFLAEFGKRLGIKTARKLSEERRRAKLPRRSGPYGQLRYHRSDADIIARSMYGTPEERRAA